MGEEDVDDLNSDAGSFGRMTERWLDTGEDFESDIDEFLDEEDLDLDVSGFSDEEGHIDDFNFGMSQHPMSLDHLSQGIPALQVFGRRADTNARLFTLAKALPATKRRVTLFPIHNIILASHCCKFLPLANKLAMTYGTQALIAHTMAVNSLCQKFHLSKYGRPAHVWPTCPFMTPPALLWPHPLISGRHPSGFWLHTRWSMTSPYWSFTPTSFVFDHTHLVSGRTHFVFDPHGRHLWPHSLVSPPTYWFYDPTCSSLTPSPVYLLIYSLCYPDRSYIPDLAGEDPDLTGSLGCGQQRYDYHALQGPVTGDLPTDYAGVQRDFPPQGMPGTPQHFVQGRPTDVVPPASYCQRGFLPQPLLPSPTGLGYAAGHVPHLSLGTAQTTLSTPPTNIQVSQILYLATQTGYSCPELGSPAPQMGQALARASNKSPACWMGHSHPKWVIRTSKGPCTPQTGRPHLKQASRTSNRPLALQMGHPHLNWATHTPNRPPAPRMGHSHPERVTRTSNRAVAPHTCTSNGSLAVLEGEQTLSGHADDGTAT
ncbi:hypothetical protein BU15DRAFT_82681 [Melanogaster broomeanus]|nr:hypothetical protein BU15DRAFT_82681 [Melanogaster broomeanus]